MRVIRICLIVDTENEDKAIRHITEQVTGWGGKVLKSKARKPRRKEKRKFKEKAETAT